MTETVVFYPTPDSIRKITELLRHGEVVALPTETVYGLAGNAISPAAVLNIFAAKQRPTFDPLIVHVSDRVLTAADGILRSLVSQKIVSPDVLAWACFDEVESALKKFWPGPLTVVLPRGSMIPDEVTSGQNTVGLRCPDHRLFQTVLSNLDFPLAAPSANRFGRISPTQAQHVLQELNGRISGILDGGTCAVGVESTIIRVENPLKVTLLRPGKIGVPELEAHFKVKVTTAQALGEQNQAQVAPGMLDEHYAPKKPLILIPTSFKNEAETLAFLSKYPESEKQAYLSMAKIPAYLCARKHAMMKTLSETGSLEEMAQSLFATMRELDHQSTIETIFCDIPLDANSGLAFAIRDRLKRASRNKPLL